MRVSMRPQPLLTLSISARASRGTTSRDSPSRHWLAAASRRRSHAAGSEFPSTYAGEKDRWKLNTRLEKPRTPYIIRPVDHPLPLVIRDGK
jgi:hypothetical protein